MTELLLQIYMRSELCGACRRILLAINNWLCNCKHRRWIKPWDGQGRFCYPCMGEGGKEDQNGEYSNFRTIRRTGL